MAGGAPVYMDDGTQDDDRWETGAPPPPAARRRPGRAPPHAAARTPGGGAHSPAVHHAAKRLRPEPPRSRARCPPARPPPSPLRWRPSVHPSADASGAIVDNPDWAEKDGADDAWLAELRDDLLDLSNGDDDMGDDDMGDNDSPGAWPGAGPRCALRVGARGLLGRGAWQAAVRAWQKLARAPPNPARPPRTLPGDDDADDGDMGM